MKISDIIIENKNQEKGHHIIIDGKKVATKFDDRIVQYVPSGTVTKILKDKTAIRVRLKQFDSKGQFLNYNTFDWYFSKGDVIYQDKSKMFHREDGPALTVSYGNVWYTHGERGEVKITN